MSKVPNGWAITSIGQITNYVQRGKSPKYADFSELPVINQKCIRWFGIQEEHLKYVDPAQWAAWSDERFLRNGDILWNSTGTGTIGRAALYRGLETAPRAVADSHVTIVRANNAVIPDFLHRFIQSPAVQSKIDDMQAGSTNQVELGKEAVLTTSVPLPPLPEQKRIVAKIDSLSGKSKRARDHLDHIPRLVEKYKQSVLDLVFSSHYGRSPLIEHVDPTRGIPYGIVQTGLPFAGGIPTIRCGDIKAYGLAIDELKLVNPQIESEYSRTRLKGGEVLIAIRGSVGETCVVPPELKGCNISREVALIPVKKSVSPKFIMYFLTSTEAKKFILGNVKGVAQQGINLRDLKLLPTPNSDLDQQQKIVGRIDQAFRWIDKLAREATDARKLINNLDQAILAKAFCGELVPQDPGDEPATKLLERIAAERAATPKAKRGRTRKV